jgi:phosphotriesterase-related protein
VTGPIDVNALGLVLMHEHVLIYSDHIHQQFPHLYDVDLAVDESVRVLKSAKAKGVTTLVDCTTPNMGRHVARMREISERSGVQIICATGFHPMIAPELYYTINNGVGLSIDDVAEMFVHDITIGAQGTDIKAGIIKVGSSPVLSDWQENAIRAAARAHRATGVPITTHTHPEVEGGTGQLDILESEGVDLSRVIIGHSGDSSDLEYLTALVRRGCYIGMDRFGFMIDYWNGTMTTMDRIEVLRAMCERGATDQMVLSHDACVWVDYIQPQWLAQANPEWNITYLFDEALPIMKSVGITDEQLNTMFTTNPLRIFSKQSTY